MTGGELPDRIEAHAGAEIGPVGLPEAPLLEVLPGKGLDDPLSRQALLEHRVEAGIEHLGVVGDAADAFPQPDDEHHCQGKDRHGQQGQAPIPVEDHRTEPQDGEGVLKSAGHHPGHGVLQQVDIVGEAAHQGAGGLAVEEGQGLAHQGGKEVVPESGDGGVADVAHLVVVGVRQEALEGVKQDDQGRQQVEHMFFVTEEDVVQDRFHQIG